MACLKPGDSFVDVGANEGMMSLLAARLVGPQGAVIAFEPNPQPRAIFAQAIARNGIGNIDLRPLGLGDQPATLSLSVPRINSGEGSFGRNAYPDAESIVVQCEVAEGDGELAGLSPGLIKIDVEGFEAHVLRGMPQLIARASPLIVTEIIGAHLDRAGSDVASITALMEGHGYAPWALGLAKQGWRQRLTLEPATLHAGYAGDVLWLKRGQEDRIPALTAPVR